MLLVEPASPVRAASPVRQDARLLTVTPPPQARRGPSPLHARRTPSPLPPPPEMTTDAGSASDASVHFAQRAHRRVPSTMAPSTVYSHRVSGVSSFVSPSARRHSFFAPPSPATRGEPSPMLPDDFDSTPEDRSADQHPPAPSSTSHGAASTAEGVTTFVNHYSYWLSPRAQRESARVQNEQTDFAESPQSMHQAERDHSPAAPPHVETRPEPPKPSLPSKHVDSTSSRPSLNAKRLSDKSTPTARSSASSSTSKRVPSLTVRIPGKATTINAPSPVRMFLVPRPKLVAEPSPVLDSARSPTTASDGSGVVQVAQLAHWSPPPEPVPPPLPRAARPGDVERRPTTVFQPVAPAPVLVATASQPTAVPVRSGAVRTQAVKAAPEPRDVRVPARPGPSTTPPRASSSKQTRETEPRARTPSPPLRVPSPPTRAPVQTPSPAVPPPPRSALRPVPSRPDLSYARPTAASSAARGEPRTPSPPKTRHEAPREVTPPPKNRYDAPDRAEAGPARSRYERTHQPPSSFAARAREEEKLAPRAGKAPVAAAPPPSRPLLPPRTPSPAHRAVSPPPAHRAASPPPRQASPAPAPSLAPPAFTKDALPLQTMASSTTLASNRQLPPLPRAPPSTPTVPHFSEAVVAALERASPPAAEPAPIAKAAMQESERVVAKTPVQDTEKAVAKTSPSRVGTSARRPQRPREFLVDPATLVAPSAPAAPHSRLRAEDLELLDALPEDQYSPSFSSRRPTHKTSTSAPAVASRTTPLPKPVPKRGMSDITILSVTSTVVDGTAQQSETSKSSLRVRNPDERRPFVQPELLAPQYDELTEATHSPPLAGTSQAGHGRKEPESGGADVHRSDTTTASTVHPSDASWEELSVKALAAKDAITKAPPGALRSIRAFEGDTLPARAQLADAAALDVVAETGVRVRFGDLFCERPTLVLFLRHFWCPHDQDYMHSVMKHVNMDALERAGVGLVAIACGSAGMIRAYKRKFDPCRLCIRPDPGVRNISRAIRDLHGSDAPLASDPWHDAALQRRWSGRGARRIRPTRDRQRHRHGRAERASRRHASVRKGWRPGSAGRRVRAGAWVCAHSPRITSVYLTGPPDCPARTHTGCATRVHTNSS
jgi:hypothetical protein